MPFDLTQSTENQVSKRYETQYDRQLKDTESQLYKEISYNYPNQEINIAPSRYDEGYLYNAQDPLGTLQEQRGQRQPWIAKLGAGIGKGLIITGTTAADGIIGTVVGLGNLAGQGKFSAFWDNPFSQWTTDIVNKADEWLPNYYTRQEQNASFLGQMGYANFWGDKFLKNLGFTAGMIIDGAITGGAVLGLGGAKNLAAKLPKGIANAIIKGDQGLNVILETGNAAEVTAEILKNAKQLDRLNKTAQGAGLVLSVQGEARFEAISNSTQFFNENKQKLDEQLAQGMIDGNTYATKLSQLQDAKEGYGNANFLANAIILGISNGVQFKNLFTKGFNPTKSIAEGITGDIAKGYTYSKPLAAQTAKIAKNILAEGIWEEQGQYAAQRAADDFYQKKFDGVKREKIDGIFQSMYKGLSDAYGTREGWDQGLIGSLTGAIGLPMVSRNQATGKYGVDWSGGIYGDIQEVKQANEYNIQAVNRLNETLKSEDFKNNYHSLIRTLSLEDEKTANALGDNKFEVLNKEHEQFISDALQFIRAGKYEDFVDRIKSIQGSDAEEVRNLFKYTKGLTINEQNYPHLTSEQQEYGDTFKGYTPDEISARLDKNSKKLLTNAETIHNLYNAYSTQYPNISEDAKEQLIYVASRLEDLNQRLGDINRESVLKYGVDINNHVSIKDNKVDLTSYGKAYREAKENQLLRIDYDPNKSLKETQQFESKIKDLPNLIAAKIAFNNLYKDITTTAGVERVEENVKKAKKVQDDIDKEAGTYTPSIGDNIVHKGQSYYIDSINEDGTYNIVDKDGVGLTVPKDEVILDPKKGYSEPQDSTEPLNDSDIPPTERSLNYKRERGLKNVATSLSTSHYDEEQGKTVVRNEEHDTYISNPSNNIKGDKVKFEIDIDNESLKPFWDVHKNLYDKIKQGVSLTKDEANRVLSNIRMTRGEDEFESIVDRIPLKILHTSSNGTVYDKGLYYHESAYDNIRIPSKILSIEDSNVRKNKIDNYIKEQKQKTRDNRKEILFALLTGKDVTLGIEGKTKGIPNTTGINKRIDEVLKKSHNQIKLGIALSSNVIWTGQSSPSMEGFGSPGNIFFETNKTANGETTHLKANISKISEEHADILWDSIVTMFHFKNNGKNSILNSEKVKGLTVGETIDLLTNMGQRTNLDNPANEGKLGEHLRDKQLYVDSNLVLHYGNNTVHLKGGIYAKNSEYDYDTEKRKFIDWATTNKNYIVNKELPKLGIELNKVMKKKFTLGSWESDGKDTYAGFLIKNGVVQTDVDEYKETGSLFHAPVVILDLTNSGIKIKPSKKQVEATDKAAKATVKASEKKSYNPTNTGDAKVPIAEEIKGETISKDKVRALPVGTTIYTEYTSRDAYDNKTTVYKPTVEVINKNGKKHYDIVNAKYYGRFFDNDKVLKLQATLEKSFSTEVNDESVNSLYKFLNDPKLKTKVDTTKSTEGVKEEVAKSKVESSIDQQKADIERRRQEELATIPKKKLEFDKLVISEANPEFRESTYRGSSVEKYDYINNKYDILLEELEKSKSKELEVELDTPKIDISKWNDGSNISFGEQAPTRLAYEPNYKYEVADLNKELAWLNSKLGDVPVEVKTGLIDLARTSKKAFGILRDNTIVLSNLAEKGTTYHEAFHKVSLLYLDNETREKIYEEARSKYNLTNLSDYEIEEYLAERFREYVISRESYSPKELTFLGRIGKFFTDLYELVKNIFTGDKRLTNIDIDRLFESIQNSKFKTYKPLQDNLDRLSGKEQALEVRGTNLENINNTKQLKAITKGLASIATEKVRKRLFDKSNSRYAKINIVDSIQDLEIDKLKDLIKTKINEFDDAARQTGELLTAIQKGTLDKEQIAFFNNLYKTKDTKELANIVAGLFNNNTSKSQLWNEVYNNYDNIFKERVVDYIKNELNIKFDVEEDSDELATKELLRFDKASYEYSAKDNMTNSIKFLLSNLNVSETKDPYTGLFEYVGMDEIWSRLMSDLNTYSTVEQMIEVLETKSDYYPYDQLAKQLKDGSELLRSQFQASFRKHRHQFLNAMFYKLTGEDGYQFYFSDADIHKASEQTIKEWGELFALSSLVDDNKIDAKALNAIFDEYQKLRDLYQDDIRDNTVLDLDPYKNKLVSIFNKLKIQIDRKTIDRLIETIRKDKHYGSDKQALSELILQKATHLFNTNSTLYKYANGKLSETDSRTKLEIKNLFKNETIVKDLATAYVEVNPQDTSDMLPGPDGNPHYVYSDHTYVTDIVKELTDDNEEYLNKLLSAPLERVSYILEQLKDPSIRSKFAVKTFNAAIQEKTGDEGRGYLDLSPIEDFLFKLYAFNKGYIPMPTLADRKTYPLLAGVSLPDIKYTVDDKGYLRINEEIIDIFYKYAEGERDRIDQAWRTVRKYSEVDQTNTKFESDGGPKILEVLDYSQLVENYHYKTNGNTKNIHQGSAYKYQIFTDFNKEGFVFERDARTAIERILESHIKETIKYSDRLGLTEEGMNKLIDPKLVKTVAEDYNGNENTAVKHILGDYTIKTLISSMESMMLFSGDLAFYKDEEDYVKRLGVLTSSGALLRLNVPNEENDSETYTTATLSKPMFDSPYYKLLYAKQKELLLKKYPDKDSKFISDILEDNLKIYTDKKIDRTDAQVYISPEMFRKISIKRGAWGPDEDEAFNLLNSTEEISPEVEQKLLNVVLNPLKYVYFDKLELDTAENEKLLIPTYDKMSLATLFRRYVSGSYMEDLLDRMEGKGKYEGLPKVDMIKYDSAVKAGNRLRSKLLNNPNSEDQSENDLTGIATYTQNFRFLRHQVITDPHQDQHTLLGTQAKKVGMANIIDDADYIINGETKKGSEVKKAINDGLSALSNKGLANLRERLNLDNNANIDEETFKKVLYEEGKKAGLSDNVLEGIQIGLSMDSMPERKWVYSRILSVVNKEVIDTYLPGNQLIQMSGYGLGLKNKDAVYDKTNDLKFIFDAKGKISGIEAKVSVRVFNDILPKELDTFEKKRDWLNSHKELLQGLGYRIPTQGQNSMIPINVVKFLPDQLGDVVILPNEFTALTGSDFDIDKLFFIRYNYELNKDGSVVKTESNLTGSKESIQNYLLDHYRGVLLSENNFLSTSSPLGAITNELKSLANIVEGSEKEADAKSKVSMSFASPVYQANVKYKYSGGKFGVGPEALNNVHHIMCQVADISFKTYIGVGPKDINGNTSLSRMYGIPEKNGREILISDWLSALIDSHVDIAKDPYIITLNVVRRTYNVVNLLVRIGYGQRTFEFVAQPILKYLVEDSKNIDASISPYGNIPKWQKKRLIEKDHLDRWEKKLNDAITTENIKRVDLDKQIDEWNPFESDLLELIKTPEAKRDALWIAKQLKVLKEFKRLDNNFAKDLNSLVMASRVDTKKYGSNLIDVNLYDKSVRKVIRENKFNNLEKLITLDVTKLQDSSFLSTYYSNSVNLIQHVFKNKSVTTTDKFFQLIDDVLKKTNQRPTDEESMGDIVNKIADDLYSVFVGRFFTNKNELNLTSSNVKTIFSNVHNFLLDTPEELQNNLLIQSLKKGRSTTENGTVIVGIPGIKAGDNSTKEDLTYAWKELLSSKDPKIVKFGKELMIYAYYTSGFKKGAFSIYHYIPVSLLKEFATKDGVAEFDEYMRGITQGLAEEGLVNTLSEGIVDELFKNNWYNGKYVSRVNEDPDVAVNDILKNSAGEPAVCLLEGNTKNYRVGSNKTDTPIYKPYILINVKDKEYLMEYIGYVPGEKNDSVIYKLTNKFGMAEKGKRIVEYGLDKSILSDNQITEVTDEQVLNTISKVRSYDMYVYLDPSERQFKTLEDMPITDSLLNDNTTSDTNIPVEDRSLNVEANLGQKPSDYVNHSGGAEGSDITWDNIGKEFGVVNNRHYWVESKTPHGNTEISKKDFEEGRYESAKAAKRNFGYQYSAMKDSRLIRNWAQVKYSDAVFAIGKIVDTGEKLFPNQSNDTRLATTPSVTGGTGYAVGMAINHNKPTYVFNQSKSDKYDIGWYTWRDTDFVQIDTPALTKNFAGIGTREINELGKQAIRDVYEKTFNGESENGLKSSPSTNFTSEVELLRNGVLEAGIYSESEEQELLDLIDKTPIQSIEDLNELNKKICNYVTIK